MGALKKLLLTHESFEGEKGIPLEIKRGDTEIRQVKDSSGNILWGKYDVVIDTQGVQEWLAEYCYSYSFSFVDTSAPDSGYNDWLFPYKLSAYRQLRINSDFDTAYHGETVNYNIKVNQPFFTSILGGGTNSYWNDSYEGISSPITSDVNFSPRIDPAEVWPCELYAYPKYGIFTLNLTKLNSSSYITARKIANPYMGGGTTTLTSGTSKVYYGDTISITAANGGNSTNVSQHDGKVPLLNRSYLLTLYGDGKNAAGWVVKNTTSYHNDYMFDYQAQVPLDIKFDYPITFATTPSWVAGTLINTNRGYYLSGGQLKCHPLLRGTEFGMHLCSDKLGFNLNGTTSEYYFTDDYRGYTAWDSSYSSNAEISRSHGNPFINDMGYSLDSTTITPVREDNISGTLLLKPSVCYIAYIYNNRTYVLDFLTGTCTPVTFGLTWQNWSSYGVLQMSAEGQFLSLVPKIFDIKPSLPLHIAGRIHVDYEIQLYDTAGSAKQAYSDFDECSFTTLAGVTGATYTPKKRIEMFDAGAGGSVGDDWSAEVNVAISIIDEQDNLLHCATSYFEVVGVDRT